MLSRLLLDDYSQQFPSDCTHTLVPPLRTPAGMMEGVLLSALDRHEKLACHSYAHCCPMDLQDLDHHTLWLQANSIEKSTVKGYTTGTHDYLHFCMAHSLINPTPQTLSHYTSRFIASGPRYLTGVWHFLSTAYPNFPYVYTIYPPFCLMPGHPLLMMIFYL